MHTQSYREGHFEARDGLRLYRRSWGDGERATVALVHGFGEHVGRHNYLVQTLQSLDIRVEGMDCRGHGRSQGKRGYIDRFDQYIQDLNTFLQIVQSNHPPDRPLFLLGHSQGGHVVLRYMLEHPRAPIDGVVVSSPFLGMTIKVNPALHTAAHLLSRTWPTFAQATPFGEEDLTHNQEMVEKTRRDPHYIQATTTRWYTETLKAQKHTMSRATEFTAPLLMQQAGQDRLVNKHTAQQFFEATASSDRQRFEYSDSFHEIYNESEDRREQAFEHLKGWLNEHIENG
ncbi:MAG: alpha/beta hydrolase [Deltaproteobacteria bacterium]|nr:MAG: alpha/beta hydrolase [Deltaproteobacteria bacterium]